MKETALQNPVEARESALWKLDVWYEDALKSLSDALVSALH